jgi:Cft2 family RNA processing exonuclease
MTMQVTFYGATREVTGSMHLLRTDNDYILMDCGMFQGRRREAAEKNRVMPFDPAMVTNMILSHAHIDHSGRIPLLSQEGIQRTHFLHPSYRRCLRLPAARFSPYPGTGRPLPEL